MVGEWQAGGCQNNERIAAVTIAKHPFSGKFPFIRDW
jgi:hypothetical protein